MNPESKRVGVLADTLLETYRNVHNRQATV